MFRSPAFRASLAYLAVSLVMTWPLAAGLARDIPWDLGDSVLNCWILQWGADHLLRALGGDLGALRGYFSGNIFHPEPLTLAYSEHLTAQVVQILPVYAVTKNIVLSYNLLFLSTFVLSGLGVFLLVRELTGSARAAFLAGLFYAFAPYRVPQFSHLQVLSSQWMPFALYGLRRYFSTGRARALAGAAAALVAQNLSNGYFLVYFAPFVAAYAIYEIADRRLWTAWRVWRDLAAAAAVVAAATVPFLLPYLELRRLGFGPRPLDEVVRFSADVWSYLTAHEALHVWGRVAQAFPRPEGELFPGLLPVVLAAIGLMAQARAAWRHASGGEISPGAISSGAGAGKISPGDIWRRAAAWLATGMLALYAVTVIVVLASGGTTMGIGPLKLRLRDLDRALLGVGASAVVLLVLSARVRAWARGVPTSAVAFYGVALVVAAWLSLGPVMATHGQRLADGPYAWLYANVPGFDGLRVPARMAMLVALFIAVLGGYGAAAIERARAGQSAGRAGILPVAALATLFLLESAAAPIGMNGTWPAPGLAPPPVPLIAAEGPPAIYRAAAALPGTAVLAEFPFGEEQYDLRYMVWSAAHGRPLLNGYSGGFPASFARNRAALGRVLDDPDLAWETLVRSGATHAIVHQDYFADGRGAQVSRWLEARGAEPVNAAGADRLYRLAGATHPDD